MKKVYSRRQFTQFLIAGAGVLPVIFSDRVVFGQSSEQLPVKKAGDNVSRNSSFNEDDDINKWIINYQPYVGSKHELAAAVVTGASQHTFKGSVSRKVGVRNNTDKVIDSIGLSIIFYGNGKGDITTKIAASEGIQTIPGGLKPGEKWQFEGKDDLPLILKPISRNGLLHGNYRADVMASKVVFTDGSVWEFVDES